MLAKDGNASININVKRNNYLFMAKANTLLLTESPRKPLYYLSILSLIISLYISFHLLLYTPISNETIAKFSLLLMVIISSLIGVFFRKVVEISATERVIQTYYKFGLRFLMRTTSFDQLSTIYVRKEFASHQGGYNPPNSRTRPMFILIADLKGFGRQKRRLRLKRYFSEEQAYVELAQVQRFVR